jgi:hypothetical protein
VLALDRIPLTEQGKPDRPEIRRLASRAFAAQGTNDHPVFWAEHVKRHIRASGVEEIVSREGRRFRLDGMGSAEDGPQC